MKQRILILESLPVIAGGQRVLLDMLPALQDYELHALLPGPGPLADALAKGNVTCHFAPMARYSLVHKNWYDLLRFPFDQLRLALRCNQMARRLRIHLLYANCSRSFVWGTIGGFLAGKPVVWHIHNLIADRKTLKLLQKIGECSAVKQVIAASHAAAEQLPNLGPKSVVIPAGVDTDLFHPDPDDRARIRREFSIPREAIVIGIVGDLIPLKGQQTFLDAVQAGPDELCPIVVGNARADDSESQAYARLLREIAPANTIFTGRRQDLAAVLNALDLLVIASERETGPLVLLEALACGIPVISTPVGRSPELLPADALFPVGDAVALAARLTHWTRTPNKLRRAKQTARAKAEAHLSLTQFRADVHAELTQILEEIS